MPYGVGVTVGGGSGLGVPAPAAAPVGVAVTESALASASVFGIPGIGRLGFESFFARDYPLIMALTLIVAASYVLVNLLVDVGYVFLDPRIRYA